VGRCALRWHRRPVPRPLRPHSGHGMTPLATAVAAPEVAVLPIGAAGPPCAPRESAVRPIGAAGPPFEGLLGTDGHRYGLSSFTDREVLVLIFASNRCPTVKAYADRMNAVQAKYGPQGVQVVALNSNSPHLYPDESYPL